MIQFFDHKDLRIFGKNHYGIIFACIFLCKPFNIKQNTIDITNEIISLLSYLYNMIPSYFFLHFTNLKNNAVLLF